MARCLHVNKVNWRTLVPHGLFLQVPNLAGSLLLLPLPLSFPVAYFHSSRLWTRCGMKGEHCLMACAQQ